MQPERDEIDTVCATVDAERLLATAEALIDVPSPTRSAGVVDRLAQLLADDGFPVERPDADWPESPARGDPAVQRQEKGRTLQFNGHLDTVHLPYEAPSVIDGVLGGSGAADMKGGLSSAIEAMRPELLPGGGILLTAHDHHEGPLGDGRQAEALIRDG